MQETRPDPNNQNSCCNDFLHQLANNTLLLQQRSQAVYPFAIHAQVAISQARGGSDGDEAFRRAQMKFQVVGETEECAPALRVQIVIRLSDDFGAGKTGDGRSSGAPSIRSRHSELKRWDSMWGIGVIARNAVGR